MICPVCGRRVGTHREPVDDDRRELVVYHPHDDTTVAAPTRCDMSGKRAAIRAVAFTATDTGIDQRAARERMLSRPQGSNAVNELLARLNEQEKQRCRLD